MARDEVRAYVKTMIKVVRYFDDGRGTSGSVESVSETESEELSDKDLENYQQFLKQEIARLTERVNKKL